jgi:hypothetical protein
LIFVFTLWCFDYFLRQLIQLRQETESQEELSIPAWIWFCVAYVIFLWASLRMIGVSETNPDMLVAAFFYLACALLVRMQRGNAGWPVYCVLGVTLGLGYLTKSIMFPVSIVCLAVAFFIRPLKPQRVLTSLAIFFCISGPYMVALSVAEGRITFGDSGLYNYAVHVNNVPRTHWQGEPGDVVDSGRPLHPTRRISSLPAAFEFGTPIGGTYPVWTDPIYWYEGIRAPFNFRREVSTESRLLQGELSVLFELHGSLIAGIFVLLFASGRRWLVVKDLSRYWFLILPCSGALALYAMIHVELRYLAPFYVGFLLPFLFAVHLPPSDDSRRLCSAVAILVLAMFFVPVASPSLNITGFVRDMRGRSLPDPDSPEQVVKEMYKLGLRSDDKIASLEYSLYGMSTWARLARARIVAEVYYWPERPETVASNFWKADSAAQARVIQALAGSGATFIVTGFAPSENGLGWQQVGSSHYYVYRIQAAKSFSFPR